MNITELNNMEHLSVNESVENKFHNVSAEDGYMITRWSDGDDIVDYVGFKSMHMPISDECDFFRIITEDEHDELCKLRNAELDNRYNVVDEQPTEGDNDPRIASDRFFEERIEE